MSAPKHYRVQAIRWEHGWELHIDDGRVTQAASLEEAPRMVADYLVQIDEPQATFEIEEVSRTETIESSGEAFIRVDLVRMNAATPGITWHDICGAVPMQGYGTWQDTGEDVYFRFRHDTARLEVGDMPQDDLKALIGEAPTKPWTTRLEAIAEDALGDPWAGELDDEQLERVLKRLLADLKPVAPRHSYRERLAARLRVEAADYERIAARNRPEESY